MRSISVSFHLKRADWRLHLGVWATESDEEYALRKTDMPSSHLIGNYGDFQQSRQLLKIPFDYRNARRDDSDDKKELFNF